MRKDAGGWLCVIIAIGLIQVAILLLPLLRLPYPVKAFRLVRVSTTDTAGDFRLPGRVFRLAAAGPVISTDERHDRRRGSCAAGNQW